MTDPSAAPPELLDVTGLICPLPVLKLRKRLQAMAPGARIAVVATDPAARIDIPHFCAETGHELLDQHIEADRFHFTVRCKPAAG